MAETWDAERGSVLLQLRQLDTQGSRTYEKVLELSTAVTLMEANSSRLASMEDRVRILETEATRAGTRSSIFATVFGIIGGLAMSIISQLFGWYIRR